MKIAMSSLLTATCAASLAVGCVKTDAPSEVGRAIPTADQVRIKLPGGGDKTVGDLSSYYVTTRAVTATLNGGSAWVLILIHAIVETPPTSVDGNVYTWGPGSQALDPADYRLDVTANDDGTFDYALSGQSKVNPDGFKTVISGHADPTPGELQGNGDFRIDFDASAQINPIDNGDNKGVVEVQYDLATKHLGLSLASTDANGNPVSADYQYDESVDGSGNMTFSADADAGGTPALEKMTLRSRWLADGSGRGDARIAAGDLGSDEALASECWDTHFKVSFYTDNVEFQPTQGDEASCAFADQDLPPL